MSTRLPTLDRLARECQELDDEYASHPVAAALAILLHTAPTPQNLMAVADLLREETADHLVVCGRIVPTLNALLYEVLEQLLTLGWAFEHRAWHHYPRTDAPLPSTRAALQEVPR